MQATKHEGAGNDFLVVLDPDDAIRFSVAQVRLLADRRRGIGADGIIRVGPGRDGSDLSMELHNADGGEAEMSGNGIRCLAQAAVDAGLVSPPRFTVATAGGARTVEYAAGRRARLGDGQRRHGPGPARPRPAPGVRRPPGPHGRRRATRTWCCSGPTPPPSTSPSSGPSCRPPSAAASTSSGSPPGRDERGRAPRLPGVGARGGRDPGLRHRAAWRPPRRPASWGPWRRRHRARAQSGRRRSR